jgi:hypothetical protein
MITGITILLLKYITSLLFSLSWGNTFVDALPNSDTGFRLIVSA